MAEVIKKKWGGKRPNQSGRPRKAWPTREEFVKECWYPAIKRARARRDVPDQVEFSITDLRKVYGAENMKLWWKVFRKSRQGRCWAWVDPKTGRFSKHKNVVSAFELYYHIEEIITCVAEELGHTIADLNASDWPTAKMLERIKNMKEKTK